MINNCGQSLFGAGRVREMCIKPISSGFLLRQMMLSAHSEGSVHRVQYISSAVWMGDQGQNVTCDAIRF